MSFLESILSDGTQIFIIFYDKVRLLLHWVNCIRKDCIALVGETPTMGASKLRFEKLPVYAAPRDSCRMTGKGLTGLRLAELYPTTLVGVSPTGK
jgi:hypothetical protein